MNTETPMQREGREWAEADARARAGMSRQERDLADALKPTATESAEQAAADERVTAAELEVGRIAIEIQRHEAGKAGTVREVGKSKDGRSVFRKLINPAAQAEAAATLPGLRLDLEAARARLQGATRGRNLLTNKHSVARLARRRAVLAKYAAKPTKPISRADPWSALAKRRFGADHG